MNVQSYIKQIQALEYIDKTYQLNKDQIEMNVHIFNICVTYEIESKEDKNRKFIDEVY